MEQNSVANFIFYISRSALETFQRCPRSYYWQHAFEGRGIVSVEPRVPLVTGHSTHVGIESLLMGKEVEEAVRAAIEDYDRQWRGWIDRAKQDGREVQDKEQLKFTVKEQRALIHGLILAFSRVLLPELLKRYTVIMVEQEERQELAPGIVLEGRVDAVMLDKVDGNCYLASFKTDKGIDPDELRKNERIRTDLQGITESWLLGKRLEAVYKGINDAGTLLGHIAIDWPSYSKPLSKIRAWLLSNSTPYRVSGVKYIFLIKGQQRLNKESGVFETHSPIIRGYRKLVGGKWIYAHSLYFDRPDGKGKSRLGKGWESFSVWEDKDGVGGVEGWMSMLMAGKDGVVQPELGNVVERRFYQSSTIYRGEEEIEECMGMVRDEAVRILLAKERLEDGGVADPLGEFPMHRHSCCYPSLCEYRPACFKPAVREDVMGSGLYQWRQPHHEGERRQMERIKERE